MMSIITLGALAVWIYMTAWFFIAIGAKDNSIADIAWGLGFVFLAVLSLVHSWRPDPRAVLVSGIVTVWGVRLAVHIFLRNRKRGEDFRYAAWRAKWGKWFVLRSYVQVFLLQGAFLFAISSSVIVINTRSSRGLGVLDLAGILLWILGFGFEVIADVQLRNFKKSKDNRGKIMAKGLWAYTRHPNYFGEALMWWGIYLLALSVDYGWMTVVSPLLITVLLRFVSGVPMLERKYSENVDFKNYAARTNAFIPWLPKKK